MTLELNEAKAWSTEVKRAGLEIRVLSGRAWVTQEGDGQDHVVEANGSFVTDRTGRVGIQALTRARIAVEAPHRAHAPLHAAAA